MIDRRENNEKLFSVDVKLTTEREDKHVKI
ncbi:Uncharacterised protein [Klebsiella oxytoca]|nr:Uncharacterised protein [Klebsiella oxytoca]SBL49064.1 Uncharacterised protein [Klebsiella oxytoca]SBL55455.1 Uncharacterised protein [Klebsiella oxytoca]SBL59619.1 Uncharacterised protein [Klebsiella oxytoca]